MLDVNCKHCICTIWKLCKRSRVYPAIFLPKLSNFLLIYLHFCGVKQPEAGGKTVLIHKSIEYFKNRELFLFWLRINLKRKTPVMTPRSWGLGSKSSPPITLVSLYWGEGEMGEGGELLVKSRRSLSSTAITSQLLQFRWWVTMRRCGGSY